MAGKSPERAARTGTVEGRSPKQRFIERLELEASMEESGESIVDVILDRMAAAGDNVDEMFAAQDVSLPSGKSLVDMEMSVIGFVVRKGDPQYEENGLGYYYVIDAVNVDTGEEIKFATGAANVLILLMNLRQAGRLPITVAIRGKQTGKGTLLTMRRAGPRTVSGTAEK